MATEIIIMFILSIILCIAFNFLTRNNGALPDLDEQFYPNKYFVKHKKMLKIYFIMPRVNVSVGGYILYISSLLLFIVSLILFIINLCISFSQNIIEIFKLIWTIYGVSVFIGCLGFDFLICKIYKNKSQMK